MGELIQLDAAAALVGKSEVTLRRLVKAGKVNAQKEKTLTGFMYRVDSDEVLTYYRHRESAFAGALDKPTPIPEPKAVEPASVGHAIASNGKLRIAVANESGNSAEYWLKRAEIYEERYHKEVQRAGQMREELGIWRGRAEHAQAMLMKMLPAPTTIEVMQRIQRGEVQGSTKQGDTSVVLTAIFGVLVLLIVGGMVAYILFNK